MRMDNHANAALFGVAVASFAAGYFVAQSLAAASPAAASKGVDAATGPSSAPAPSAKTSSDSSAQPAAAASAPAAAPASGPAPAPAPAPSSSTSSAAPAASPHKAVRTEADVLAAEEAEEDSLEDSSALPESVELKMVILVRSDLNMSKGKIAAQVGHAVLGSFRVAQRLVPEYCKAWLFRAQAKVTLKVEDEAALLAAAAAARAAGLPLCVIEDAGRTEVEPGTRTVCGIGPAPKAEIDALTGPKGRFPLKLLS